MISNQVEMYLSEKKKTYLSDPILIFPNPPTPRIALSLPPSSNAHPHPSMYNVCVNSIDQYCPDVGDVLNLIPPCREWENVHYIKPIAILVKDEGGQRLPEPELDVVRFVAAFTPDHDDGYHDPDQWSLQWSWWAWGWWWSLNDHIYCDHHCDHEDHDDDHTHAGNMPMIVVSWLWYDLSSHYPGKMPRKLIVAIDSAITVGSIICSKDYQWFIITTTILVTYITVLVINNIITSSMVNWLQSGSPTHLVSQSGNLTRSIAHRYHLSKHCDWWRGTPESKWLKWEGSECSWYGIIAFNHCESSSSKCGGHSSECSWYARHRF